MSEVDLVFYQESPVFFDVDGSSVFGVISRPPHRRNGTGVIVLPGGGAPLSTNRNRVSVRIGRGLAAMGYTALRMDYHGTGESSGAVEAWNLAHPFVDDVSAAVGHLRDMGLERFVIIGTTCFGSKTAVASAAGLDGVEEVLAFATPIRDAVMGQKRSVHTAMDRSFGRYVVEALRPKTIRGMTDRRNRRLYRKYARAKLGHMAGRLKRRPAPDRSQPPGEVSPGLKRDLERLVARRVRVLFVYGTEDDDYGEFLAAQEGPLKDLLSRAGSSIPVATIPGRLHGLPAVAEQEAVIELILEWARDRNGGISPEPAAQAEDA